MKMSKLKVEYIRRIYGNAKGQGLDNDELHSLVFQLTGKDSITKLTEKEAERVICKLRGKRVHIRSGNGGKGMITEKQKKLLFALMYEFIALDGGNKAAVGVRLSGMARKMHGQERVEWLSAREASELAEGIKKMIERKKKNDNQENTKSAYTPT